MSETTVPTGQTVNGAVVGSGDDQRVNGTSNDTVVNQGGTQFVNGTANSTIINYGGSQIVDGVVNNTIVNYAGDQRIYSGSANNTILNGGTQVIYGGLTLSTVINDGGYQSVVGGRSDGTLVGSGAIQEVFGGGSQIYNTTIENTGVQLVDAGTGPTNILGDRLLAGGHIRIQGLDDNTHGSLVYDQASNTLSVQEGSQSFSIGLTGNYTGAVFSLNQYGGRAVDITFCFCRQTRIRTPQGDLEVENLGVGDFVITRSGRQRPITWIGSSTAIVNDANRPVIIHAGAFLDGSPFRSVRVTRWHSFLFGDVLIPIGELVNHQSICWDEAARTVEVFHIGLETHDVLLAEGAPAESYRNDGNVVGFAASTGAATKAKAMPSCAPVVAHGPIVERTRIALSRWAKITFKPTSTSKVA